MVHTVGVIGPSHFAGAVGMRSRASRRRLSDNDIGCSASDRRWFPARPAQHVHRRRNHGKGRIQSALASAHGRNGKRGVETSSAGRAGAHRPSEALHPTRSSDVLPRIARERVPTVRATQSLRKRVENVPHRIAPTAHFDATTSPLSASGTLGLGQPRGIPVHTNVWAMANRAVVVPGFGKSCRHFFGSFAPSVKRTSSASIRTTIEPWPAVAAASSPRGSLKSITKTNDRVSFVFGERCGLAASL